MQRRALLVLLAGLSGCTSRIRSSLPDDGPFGVLGGSDSESTAVGPTTPTATRTPTPTATPTPEALPSTPDPETLRSMSTDELVDLALTETERAIAAYVGDGDALTDVRASSTSFDPSAVISNLYAAKLAYEEGNRQGISATQRETIDQLARLEVALRHTIDAQVQLTQAYVDLENARTALSNGDGDSAVSALQRATSRRELGAESVAKMNRPSYERAAALPSNLTTEEYRAKLSQFRAESDGMAVLIDGVELLSRGVTTLQQAIRKEESGAPYEANELAQRAESTIQDGIDQVRVALGGYRAGASSLVPLSMAFLDTAREKQAEARDIYR